MRRSMLLAPPVTHAVRLDGTSGTYISADDHADFHGTDLDLAVEAALDDWTPSTESMLICKSNASGTASAETFRFSIRVTGNPRIIWSDGTNLRIADATAATGFSDRSYGWVRTTVDVDDGAGNHVVNFYTRRGGGAWTQLGSTVTAAGVSVPHDTASAVTLGANLGGALLRLTGFIRRAEARSGIGGALIATPDFTKAPFGAKAVTDSVGKSYALNGAAHVQAA